TKQRVARWGTTWPACLLKISRSSGRGDKTGMSFRRSLQGRRMGRRVQQQLDEAMLVFDRKVDDLSSIDSPVRNLLIRNYKIADAAALQLRCMLDEPERLWRKFELRSVLSGLVLGHGSNSSFVFCCTG